MPRTVRFEARDVYNLPLSEGFLVLDARGVDAYERSHLSGAWRLTQDLDELLRLVDDENPPEQLSTILVCAAPGDGVRGSWIRAASAAAPRRASTEYPRGTRGGAATRLRGISTWHPAGPRPASAEYPRGTRGRAATRLRSTWHPGPARALRTV